MQAVGHIPVDSKTLNVDFLTASAHKFNGAKGTGFMYIRNGVIIPSLVMGGNQEYGYRAGTENVAGIVAAAFALEECVDNMEKNTIKLNEMVENTYSLIKSHISNCSVNGNADSRLPGIINLRFNGVSGEALMNWLSFKKIYISIGSACHAGETSPSHVLVALGLNEDEAKSSVRISYGACNSKYDAETVATAIIEAYSKIKNSYNRR